jgi:urease accessory protein
MPYDAARTHSATLERGNGSAELSFARRGEATAISHLYQHDPCRVLFPRAEPGDPPCAVLLTTSGGLTGGDRLKIVLAAGACTSATVTSQAAEKVYRSLGTDCLIDVDVTVDAQAWLEWLPQETILFDRARLRRTTRVDVAASGRFFACEMLVFGRSARGEAFATGSLYDGWRIARDGRLVWVDALRLDGDIGAKLARGLGGAGAVASAFYVGDDASGLLEPARALVETSQGRAGVTFVNGVLLARFFDADATIVRRDLIAYLGRFRQLAAGLPARLPRVWYN